jgi:hypothetical protein
VPSAGATRVNGTSAALPAEIGQIADYLRLGFQNGAALKVLILSGSLRVAARSVLRLADLAARGELTLRVAETVPRERFRDASLRLERGGLPGKIVLTP